MHLPGEPKNKRRRHRDRIMDISRLVKTTNKAQGLRLVADCGTPYFFFLRPP
jgi:hypothetical protein